MILKVQGTWEGQEIIDLIDFSLKNGYVNPFRLKDLRDRLDRQVSTERHRRRDIRKAESKARQLRRK